MNNTTTLTNPGEQTTDKTLYLAFFRVAAIADLKGPAKAVEWAQSVLDDDRLRAAFVAGVSSKRRHGVHGSESAGGRRHSDGRFGRPTPPDPTKPVHEEGPAGKRTSQTMGDPGLEPGTSSLSEKRSNRLS